jgi:hypothetical protein
MAFLTLVDLFATQAILPSLAAHYGSTPAQTGLAVNATTIGMAVSSPSLPSSVRGLIEGLASSSALRSSPSLHHCSQSRPTS